MSDPAGDAPTPTEKVETVVEDIAAGVTKALPVVETIAAMLAPEAAPAIATAVAIAKGVVAGVPEAIALWDSVQSGVVPTQAQLDEYLALENSDYEKVMADIQAKLAAS